MRMSVSACVVVVSGSAGRTLAGGTGLARVAWLTGEMVAAKRAEPNTQVTPGMLITNETMKTTAEIDEAIANGTYIEVRYL